MTRLADDTPTTVASLRAETGLLNFVEEGKTTTDGGTTERESRRKTSETVTVCTPLLTVDDRAEVTRSET